MNTRLSTAVYAVAASFSVKRGGRCLKSEIVRSASVHGDLRCLSFYRTDGRDVIFVKKNSKPYKTDCGSVTNGDLLRRMNNRELADVIGFFARWMQRADIGEGLQLYFHFIKNI